MLSVGALLAYAFICMRGFIKKCICSLNALMANSWKYILVRVFNDHGQYSL